MPKIIKVTNNIFTVIDDIVNIFGIEIRQYNSTRTFNVNELVRINVANYRKIFASFKDHTISLLVGI